MRFKSSDELSVNLADAQLQWGCLLNPTIAEGLIEKIAGKYGTDDFEKLLDGALDDECIEGNERHAYKMALGLFFGNRARIKLAERREAFSIPFAPR